MKVYLVARYSRFKECQHVRDDLNLLGHTVTSRWIAGDCELTRDGSREASNGERAVYAQQDMEDLLAADCVIVFTEEPRKTNTRGGRHVEFGVALALKKRVIVIGWRENVFHCLPHCEFFHTWPAAARILDNEARVS